MAEQEGSAPLFAIFVLSIYSLFLIPYTIYKLCLAAAPDEVVKPWEQKKLSAAQRFARKFFTVQNVTLALCWLAWLALVVYVQSISQELAPFDPYEILKIDRGATEKEVKKAYRQLSLIYHPDKNPDPAAATYFAESITKAYKALTDDASRENYEKYGHPDGPQALNMGVALPEWLLSQDAKAAPFVLIALVFVGILLPLGIAACFLMSSNQYAGPNNVMRETLEIFLRSKFAVKESQGLGRVLDTLVYAYEFILMPTPAEQAEGLEALRRTILRVHPDLKEKPQFWKRRPSIVKVNMLLLAHLSRAEVAPALQADLKSVLKRSPQFLDEMINIANLPRPPAGFGWLAPTVGCLEMAQCLTQALSIAARKSLSDGSSGKKGGSDINILLQLPHFDHDVVKKIGRKKVGSLAEVAAMDSEERLALFVMSGLTKKQAEQAATSLGALPTITMADVKAQVDGEAEETQIVETDIVTCSARVLLTRASHLLPGAEPPTGRAVLAYAPLYPFPKEEKWSFVVADQGSNTVYARAEVSLVEAEAAAVNAAAAERQRRQPQLLLTAGPGQGRKAAAEAAASASSGKKQEDGAEKAVPVTANGSAGGHDSADESSAATEKPAGQLVEVKFRAPPKPGKYDLTLLCISDCWAGVDRAAAFKLRVIEQSRAEKEGRAGAAAAGGGRHGAAAAAAGGGGAEGRTDASGDETARERDDGEDAFEDDEEEEEDEEDGDWDSEDSGTEESGSEDEAEDEKDRPAGKEDAKEKEKVDKK